MSSCVGSCTRTPPAWHNVAPSCVSLGRNYSVKARLCTLEIADVAVYSIDWYEMDGTSREMNFVKHGALRRLLSGRTTKTILCVDLRLEIYGK